MAHEEDTIPLRATHPRVQVAEPPAPAPAARAEPAEPAPAQAGDYVLGARIGEGGFGDVFRARHRVMDRPAAVKILSHRYSADPDMVERFVREARAVCAIRSPDIADVFDFGTLPDGRRYFAMELLEGETLHERFVRQPVLPPDEVVALLTPIARALDAAHEAGVVHRDVKPGNIFIEQDGGRTRLLDFGIARLDEPKAGERLTQTGHTVGTPTYMAPEQALGRPVDGRADIYALGIVAFEALTGEVPFDAGSFHETQAAHIHEALPDAHERNRALSRDVSRVLAYIAAKDPAERPGSAQAAVAELSRALCGERLRDTPARPRGRRAPWAVAALLGAAGLGWWTLRPVDAPPDPVPAPVAPVEIISVPAAPPVETQVTFALTPADATVHDLAGAVLRRGAGVVSFVGDEPRTFVIRAPGHEPAEVTVPAGPATVVPVTLTATPEDKAPVPAEEPKRGPNDIEPW